MRRRENDIYPLPTELTMLSVLVKRLTVLSSPDMTDSGIVGGITVVVIVLQLPQGKTISRGGTKAMTDLRPGWAATRRRKRAALMMTA
jgi:hypothetical protein